jgi:uncharacterized protein (DUF488 family)
MLDAYKKRKGNWAEYERAFLTLLRERRIEDTVDRVSFNIPTVMLCSEHTAEDCHRRLVLEYLQQYGHGVIIRHL